MHKSAYHHHDVVSDDPNSTFDNSCDTSYSNTFNSYQPAYKQNVDIPYPTGLQNAVRQVYNTENYPDVYLRVSGNSSSDSSPIASPILGDHFTLDQQTKDYSCKVKRKSSRASIRSNRNSMLLDPIVEEELPINAIKSFGSPPSSRV